MNDPVNYMDAWGLSAIDTMQQKTGGYDFIAGADIVSLGATIMSGAAAAATETTAAVTAGTATAGVVAAGTLATGGCIALGGAILLLGIDLMNGNGLDQTQAVIDKILDKGN